MADGPTVTIPSGFAQATFHLTHTGLDHVAMVTLGLLTGVAELTQSNVDALLTGFSTAIRPLYDNEVTFSQVHVLQSLGGNLTALDAVSTIKGSDTINTVVPPNVTYLLAKATTHAGRRHRGRMYLPYVFQGDIDQGGRLTTGGQTRLQTAGNALIPQLVNTSTTGVEGLVLLHSAMPGDTPLPPSPITGFIARSKVATQRRRLR